jgi:uncharacterized protein YbbK (DUF523 family)
MIKNNNPILISACLAGLCCRYDGRSRPNDKVVELIKKGNVILVCPEQLGGLPTPRVGAERVGDKVLTKEGTDVTSQYQKGAEEVIKLAKLVDCKKAILKAKSPSCGSNMIYDGTFSGTLTEGNGVCAELLKKNGIEVVTENEI